jgi:hypothetical protein
MKNEERREIGEWREERKRKRDFKEEDCNIKSKRLILITCYMFTLFLHDKFAGYLIHNMCYYMDQMQLNVDVH